MYTKFAIGCGAISLLFWFSLVSTSGKSPEALSNMNYASYLNDAHKVEEAAEEYYLENGVYPISDVETKYPTLTLVKSFERSNLDEDLMIENGLIPKDIAGGKDFGIITTGKHTGKVFFLGKNNLSNFGLNLFRI